MKKSLKVFENAIQDELETLKENRLYKKEYSITSSQSASIEIELAGSSKKVLNFCANNYLGLANDPRIEKAAIEALQKYGLGTASVRFICGTMNIHKKMEEKLAAFLGYEDVISYSSCFAANNGVFAALFDENDAIISADLNHASLIDGIRLCKAARFFYHFDDMADLEKQLQAAQDKRYRLIVTDGVFSMDGDIVKLKEVCDLADKYDALVMVDDSHATGFVGKNGRGTPEFLGMEGRVDILSSTLGKAIGGAGGGFIAASKLIIDKLRNKSRPYLFSNNIIPAVAAGAIAVLEILEKDKSLIAKLEENTAYFRKAMVEAGFNIRAGIHPVAPVMLYDAKLAAEMARL